MPLGCFFLFVGRSFIEIFEFLVVKQTVGDFSLRVFSYLFSSKSCSIANESAVFAQVCLYPKNDNRTNR